MTQNNDEKLHFQEAEELKKRWHTYVYDTLKGLDVDIKNIREETKRDKEELNLRIDALKDQLISELNSFKDECNRLNLDNSDLQNSLDSQIEAIKRDLEKYIDGKFEDFKEKINTKIEDVKIVGAVTKTRLAVYSAVVSLILVALITTIAGGVLLIFGDALKSFFGAG